MKDDQKRSITILAVEDNSVNQLVLKTILTKLGHTVDLAPDGEEAVKMASEKRYDLIFMDLQLPGMNGIEACDILRRGINATTPVYAITADSTKEEHARCMEVGMNGCLVKPYRSEEMEAIISRHFDS